MKRLLSHLALIAIATLGVRAQEPSRAGAQRESGATREERLSRDLRTGQYADATRLVDEMLATGPHDDLKNVRALFGGQPNMRIRHRSAGFVCDVSDKGVRLPLSIGGSPVQMIDFRSMTLRLR